MAVEQVLTGTIKPLSCQFFSLKKDTKDCQKGHAQSRLQYLLHWISDFFFQFIFKYLHFLFCKFFPNLSGLFMHSPMKLFVAFSPLTFTLSKNYFASTDAAFPVTMLYLSLSVWLNGFIISHRSSVTLCNSIISHLSGVTFTDIFFYCHLVAHYFQSFFFIFLKI